MRKVFFILLLLGLTLVANFTIPVLAQGTEDQPANALDEMHNACQSGDADAMLDAAQKAHGSLSEMPCNGAGGAPGMGGTMGTVTRT